MGQGRWLGLGMVGIGWGLGMAPAIAQVVPAQDGFNSQVQVQGDRLEITGGQTSADGGNLFHSFDRFHVQQGQVADFVTVPAIQNILGRVVGGEASWIDGRLQVTGSGANLYLLNPAGLIFGPNAQLNVPADFVGATATGVNFGDLRWDAAGLGAAASWSNLVGMPTGFEFSGVSGGSIANFGALAVAPGAGLTLLGGTVWNGGALIAPGGRVTVAAVPGQSSVRWAIAGNVLGLELQPTALGPAPAIAPLDLPTLLTGHGIDGATQAIAQPNGSILLTEGTSLVTGLISTLGDSPGAIAVLGDRVIALGGTVDASSAIGGGSIRFGGDLQGQGNVFNAQRAFVDRGSRFLADGVFSGDGGRTIIWADGSTQFYGNISAQGDRGGFAEVSGKETLNYAGLADLRSRFPDGPSGTLLLDPTDITISTAATSGDITFGGTTYTGTAASSNLNNTDLSNQLGISSVTVSTASLAGGAGNITLDPGATISWTTPNTLTFRADGDITTNSAIIGSSGTFRIEAGGGTVTFNNDINIRFLETVAPHPQTINLNFPAISTGTGSINLTTVGGDITVSSTLSASNSNINLTANGGSVVANSAIAAFPGNITLTSTGGGDVEVNNGISAVPGGSVNINASETAVVGATIQAADGIAIQGASIALDGNLTAEGGNPINLTSLVGDICPSAGCAAVPTNQIRSNAFTPTGGAVIINSARDLTINSVDAGTGTSTGGEIRLEAAGALTTTGLVTNSGSSTGNGPITVLAAGPTSLGPIQFYIGGGLEINTFGALTLNGITTEEQTVRVGNLRQPSSITIATPINLLARGGSLQMRTSGTLTLNPGINVRSVGGIDITAGAIAAAGSTFSTANPNTADSGPLRLTATSGGIQTGNLDTSNGGSLGPSGGGPVILSAPQDITVGNINTASSDDGQGGPASLTSSGGAIAFGSINTSGGDLGSGAVAITAATTVSGGDITAQGTNQTPSFGSNVTVTAPGGISLGNLTTLTSSPFQNAGAVNLTASGGAIAVADITSTALLRGGPVTLTAGTTINGGAIAAIGGDEPGGNVSLTGPQGITIGDIASRATGNQGGSITLRSVSGPVTFGNLDSSGTSGGDIFVESGVSIFGGTLFTRAFNGPAGNVTLDPPGDVVVDSINASSGAGPGGNVVVVTGSNFRATGSFPCDVGLCSIDTAGSAGDGSISINHGGNGLVPFDVATGGPVTNGTVEQIYTGNSTATPGSYLYTTTFGNISLVSVPEPLPTPTPVPTPEPIAEPIAEPSPEPAPPAPEPIASPPIQPPSPEPIASPPPPPLPEPIASPPPIPEPIDPPPPPEPIASPPLAPPVAIAPPGPRPEAPPPIQPPPPAATPEAPPETPPPLRDSTPIRPPRSLSVPEPGPLAEPVLEPVLRRSIVRLLDTAQIEPAVELLDQLYSNQYLTYLGLPPRPTLPSVPETQERLEAMGDRTGTTPVIIYALAREQQLDLILIPPKSTGRPIYRSVPAANQADLLEQSRQLRLAVTNPLERQSDAYQKPARQVYDWLIRPILADLDALGADTLVFSLDRGLRSLPLAALMGDRGFLVENYALALVPSLNLTDTRHDPLDGSTVLAMGASEFAGFADLSPLPAVPVELNTIVAPSATAVPSGDRGGGGEETTAIVAPSSAPFGGLWPGQIWLNQDFTFENLRRSRATHANRLVHLATHAEFKPGDPQNSFIQFNEGPVPVDNLRQLNWTNPPVELLVLSACRTALGDEDVELGFGGLAVRVGAKSALASLWYVSDSGTLGLMSQFYDGLHQAPTKAAALQRAQVAMLRGTDFVEGDALRTTRGSVPLPPAIAAQWPDSDLSHPYYWAAFTMIGSPW
jgi:filamentous hemagglutinin family protein